MPLRFNGDARGNAAAGEEVQHGRTRKRQRAHDAIDQFPRLLSRMADALLRIAVEPRNPPDVGGIDALVETVLIEALVALVDREPLRIERRAHRVEIEIVFWRFRKPGN